MNALQWSEQRLRELTQLSCAIAREDDLDAMFAMVTLRSKDLLGACRSTLFLQVRAGGHVCSCVCSCVLL